LASRFSKYIYGCSIGEDCLIGAGALVTKNTNSKGVPARYIKDVEEDEII